MKDEELLEILERNLDIKNLKIIYRIIACWLVSMIILLISIEIGSWIIGFVSIVPTIVAAFMDATNEYRK